MKRCLTLEIACSSYMCYMGPIGPVGFFGSFDAICQAFCSSQDSSRTLPELHGGPEGQYLREPTGRWRSLSQEPSQPHLGWQTKSIQWGWVFIGRNWMVFSWLDIFWPLYICFCPFWTAEQIWKTPSGLLRQLCRWRMRIPNSWRSWRRHGSSARIQESWWRMLMAYVEVNYD